MQQFDESRAKAPVVYYPNNIGIATPGSISTYSFLVDGKSENGSEMVYILEELLKRGAKILSQSSWVYESLREFTLSITCDLKDSKETPDDFVIKLRALRFVNNAKVISLKRRMFSGLLFPLTMMDTSRVVALNAEGIFHIQDRLKTHAQRTDLVDAGRDVGKDIVRQIREKFEASEMSAIPNLDQVLKDNVVGFMSSAGWGKIRWEQNNNAQRVLIQDPPTVSYGGTAAGNYFLQGIIAGLTEGFFHRKYNVVDDHYDNELRLLSLSLMEQEVIGIGQDVQNNQLSNQDKTVVLKEVEKIIQSVEKSTSVPVTDKTTEVQTAKTAVSQTMKEETSLVAPTMAVGGQLQVRTGNKNELAPNTVEKEAPVVPNPQPDVRNQEVPRTGETVQPDQDQSQYQTQRRKPRRRTELSPPAKNKEEISDVPDKSMDRSLDSANHEEITHPAENGEVKKIAEDAVSNEKFKASGTTNESYEKTNRGHEVDKVEATERDNTVNRFQGATSPGQVTHIKRNTVAVKSGSEDPENDEFSLNTEDELYYGESFD